MKLPNALFLAVLLGFTSAAAFAEAGQAPEPAPTPQQTVPAADEDPLKVTIRPHISEEPPPLYDLVIRSADGRLMFLYEWLTRPREGAGRLSVAYFDIDFYAPPVDRETRELTLHTSDFGRILGKEYRYLDFEQISAEYGWESATQLVAASRYRGVYLAQTAEDAFNPLDQSYGKLLFQPTSFFGLREWWRKDVLMVE